MSNNPLTTTADLMAQALAAYGIQTVYGLPGGASLPILAALQRHGLDFVLVRNESSAVYMADVTARLTGKPSVCLVTLGPGATNALAGVSHAFLDRAPVLILTADFPETVLGRHTHQVLDLQAVFRPFTKHTARLRPAQAAAQVQAALDLTLAGRPGPVHLSLTGTDADTAVPRITITPTSTSPNQPDAAALAQAAALLNQASRPVIVVGLGLEPERPYLALRQLAERLNAPVIDTPKSKGAFPADHPLFAGTIGLMKSDPAYAILDEADLVLAVGLDVVELVRIWDYTPLIWLATWPNEDPALTAVCELVGTITPTLQQLTATLTKSPTHWGNRRVGQLRQQLAARPLPPPAPNRLLPQQVLATLAKIAPADTVITTDVGSHKILTALTWPATVPNRYMVSNGLSAMGFGVPAAIAAARVLGKTAVCVTGDAGFSMVIGELGLLAEQKLPVVIIIMNDAALDLIRAKQIRREEPIYGTEFVNPDFAAIAQAYGLAFARVTDERGCETAVSTAFATAQPTLIEALIDPTSYPSSPEQGGAL